MSDSWAPAARSAEARALYAAADADRSARPERYSLDTESLLARALGDDDPAVLGDGDWREGFSKYLDSAAEDGGLNALGARMVADTAVGRLRARRALERHLSVYPSVRERPIRAPIVITGGWRTGTTFLFRLLAADARLRALLPAELSAPWRFAGLDSQAREAALDAAAGAHSLLHLLSPELAVVHDSGARLPEECVLAMGTDFRNWGFPSTTRLDGYAAWLASQSFRSAYRRYREILQMLDDGRRFVLKAPAHCAELASLVEAFPDAMVVHLHRDIVETIASGASLFAVFRSTYSDSVDPRDVGRYQTEQTALWLDRTLAFRDGPEARGSGARFVDLDYRALVAEPLTAVRRIYDMAGLELGPEARESLARHRAREPAARARRAPLRAGAVRPRPARAARAVRPLRVPLRTQLTAGASASGSSKISCSAYSGISSWKVVACGSFSACRRTSSMFST